MSLLTLNLIIAVPFIAIMLWGLYSSRRRQEAKEEAKRRKDAMRHEQERRLI